MIDRIDNFLELRREDLNALAERYPYRKSIELDWQELERYDSELAEALIAEPDKMLELFDKALNQKEILLPEMGEKKLSRELHVRFKNLPKEKNYTLMIRDIDSDFITKFVSTDGVVNRISDILHKPYIALFQCVSCRKEVEVKQEKVDRLKEYIRKPLRCPECGRPEFRFIEEKSTWINFQVLEIQEPLEVIKGGEQARRVRIWVEDDLTDRVRAGDKVIATGITRLQPPQKKGAVYTKFLEANNIERVQKEFEDIDITKTEEKEIKKLARDPRIYEKIVKSIAPSIYGYREVKEAIALQLFGGRQGKILPDETKVRGDIHLLLIGDPGAAKSRLLKYVDQIAPKSIYVSGKGTTGAGLTATAEKDDLADGAWTIRAGALVLAGGGIACIDEFDKMDKEDRESMHEAMEQQTISVAKAGIMTTFRSNTSILAAANPKFSRFDNYKALAEQFDIPPTLISRFDLIFPIRDIPDREQDRRIAEHMLKMHKNEESQKDLQPDISVDLLRKYIAYSRKTASPMITEECSEKLRDYYVNMRAGSQETVRATARQLEALVRLAEASAKVRLSDKATIDDAERVIALTDFVLREIATDKATGEIDMDRVISAYPKSTRDRIRTVEDIIRKIVATTQDKLAPMDDIRAQAEAKNITREDLDRVLAELKNKGIIFEPRNNKFGLVESA